VGDLRAAQPPQIASHPRALPGPPRFPHGNLASKRRGRHLARVGSISAPSPLSSWALRAGVLVPFVYFGVQLVVGLRTPGYDFGRDVASQLGQPTVPLARVFNTVVIAQGLVTLAAAAALPGALRRGGTGRLLAWLASVALALNGAQTVWAGWFPLPDPRHGGHSVLVVPMIALPGLLAAALWARSGRALRGYWLVSLLLFAAVFPFMAGLVPFERARLGGLLQRVFALSLFPPIGVACALAARALPGVAPGAVRGGPARIPPLP